MARENRRIHVGDQVKVIAGAQAGQTGRVLRILSKKGSVIVEGVNVIKRHKRGETRGQGTIVEKEGPIHLSNVMVLDGESNPTRVGVRTDDSGKRKRFGKRDEANLD